MSAYIEFCNEQADKIFQIIDEHEGLLQWKKTWNVEGCFGLPKSKHGCYRGVNLWNLLYMQINQGLLSDTWLTFNQVKQQGGHVLKGAEGARVCFFKSREVDPDECEENDKQIIFPIFKMYTVFNLDQTSLAEQIGGQNQQPVSLQSLLTTLAVTISEFGSQAFYSAKDGVIVMPKREFFNNSQDFDITLLHELVHWTGDRRRLNRDSFVEYAKSDASRAEEELVAEIGSVFLASYFGISGDLINHASYVASWKKLLNGKAVGRAISQASKAFQWLISHMEEQKIEAAA